MRRDSALYRPAPPGYKWCPFCEEFRPFREFAPKSTYCRRCSRLYQKRKQKEYYRKNLASLREEGFKHYGETCSVCGEDRKDVLLFQPLEASDTFRTLKKLKKEGWPSPGLEVICRNCSALDTGDS